MKVFFSCSAALAAVASAANIKNIDQKTIATELKFDTKIRICNAYPFVKDAVQVFDQELPYKTCAEVEKSLKEGDQIDFFTMQRQILLGSFEVQEMPQQNSMLLLVIQPHDSTSSGVAFQSHAFASSHDPQLALLDGYVSDGAKSAVDFVDIRDQGSSQDSRKEELRFNSVVAVHPGAYEVGLSSMKSFHTIRAGAEEKYSVIRVGVAGSQGAYPEDLIVFPNSSAVGIAGVSSAALVALAVALAF